MSLKHVLQILQQGCFTLLGGCGVRDMIHKVYVPRVILPVHHNPRIARRSLNKLLPIGHRCRGDVGLWEIELVA